MYLLRQRVLGNFYFWVLFQALLIDSSLKQVIACYEPAVAAGQLNRNLVNAHSKTFRYDWVLWLMGEKENNPIPVFLTPVTASAAGRCTRGSAESYLASRGGEMSM